MAARRATIFGDDCLPGPVLPLICVPTTAGTGSEVAASCVLTDAASTVKVGVLSNYLRPRLAIVDPLLTLSCPAKVTADSGIDALTHAIEAYTAVDNAAFRCPRARRRVYQGRHPLADALAEKAIRLIGQNLERAVAAPNDDGSARAACRWARRSLGWHSRTSASRWSMPWSIRSADSPIVRMAPAIGLFLPYVMRFNLPEREREWAQVRRRSWASTRKAIRPCRRRHAAIERMDALKLSDRHSRAV